MRIQLDHHVRCKMWYDGAVSAGLIKSRPVWSALVFECFFCDKEYNKIEEFEHHLNLDHQGMSSETLDNATTARETKKQLGDYVGTEAKGNAFECPLCFEMFTDLEKLKEHGFTQHQKIFEADFLEKLQSMPEFDENTPPVCEICNRKFLGLVISKFDGVVKKVCFNCYGDHYGENALTRLTIGTPDDVIKKMKDPLSYNN